MQHFRDESHVWDIAITHDLIAVGLDDRGHIVVGQKADLVLVEENTPGDQHPRVRCTIRGGVPVFLDGYMANQFQLTAMLREFSV